MRYPDTNSHSKRIVFIPTSIEEELISDDFKKLCLQDEIPIHNLMLEAIQLVFHVHHWPPGNPQLSLQNYQQKQFSLGKCGYANCSAKAIQIGIYGPNGREYKLCLKHVKVAEGDSKNWMLKGVRLNE